MEQEMNTNAKKSVKRQHRKLKKSEHFAQFASKSKKLRNRNSKLQKLSSARLAAYGVL